MFSFSLDKSHYQLGEQVGGSATWTPDKDCKPSGVVVELGWRTEGRGDTDSHYYDKEEVSVSSAQKDRPVTIPVNLMLPSEGPLSYEGKLITIIWEVRVCVKISFGWDKKESHPIRVSKESQEHGF